MPPASPVAALVLLAVNLWTLARFGQDKRRARAGRRRVAEADLLVLAAIGGTPAAFLARRLFRHKTRKQPFTRRLRLIAASQVAAIGGWLLL